MSDRIMLVEDEGIFAIDLQQRLETMGYAIVAHATSGEEAIQMAGTKNPDLILMDIKIRGHLDGIQAAAKIRETQDIAVIYVTAYADEPTLARARLTEAYGYLIKPLNDRELLSTIEIALYKHKLEKKLRESEERYRKVVSTSPDGIAIIGADACLLEVNQKNAEMWGYENPGEMIGLNLYNLITPEDSSRAAENMRRVMDGCRTISSEYRFLRKDGSFFYGELNSSCLQNSSGKAVSFIAITRDITDRKIAEEELRKLNLELEQRVELRTASLEASNKELEAFSYSVAHDLRSPLRGMMGFSQILLEDYSASLDSQGQDYLKRIQAASRTMSELIDDLLSLSRLIRIEMTLEEVDLGAIARQISLNLTNTQPDRAVEFILPEQLMARADPTLIRIVLENLIGNAWKFSSKVPKGRIEFGSTIRNGQTFYFIKDNGVGFEMKYAENLFGTFQRLHSGHEFEGNGVGLSIVHRIIRRHNGRVWGESEIGKGAVFYFTLP